MELDIEMACLYWYLRACGLSHERTHYLMNTHKSYRKLMLSGLPKAIAKRVLVYFSPPVRQGTPSTSDVSDLLDHHLTQEQRNWVYDLGDRTWEMQEASKVLCDQRAEIRGVVQDRFIQEPTCQTGKRHGSRGSRQIARRIKKRQPSKLCHCVSIDDIDEEDGEEDTYYKLLCERFDDDLNKPVFDENFTRSSMGNTSLCGQPNSDLVSTEAVGKNMKRKRESALPLEPITNGVPDYVDHESKRRKLEKEVPNSAMEEKDDFDIEMDKAMEELFPKDVIKQEQCRLEVIVKPVDAKEISKQEQCSDEVVSKPVDTEEISKQRKRKRGCPTPLEPPTEDLTDDVDRGRKRRRLDGLLR